MNPYRDFLIIWFLILVMLSIAYYGGYCTGKNTSLVPNDSLVTSAVMAEKGWHYKGGLKWEKKK